MIANNYDSFVALWRQLRQTHESFTAHHLRFCVRRIIQHWHKTGLITPEHLASLPLEGEPEGALDDFIWEVCLRSELLGYDDLPPPELEPLPHREMLCALVMVVLKIGKQRVKLRDLDRAYSAAFPGSTPLNVNKKKR